MSAPTPSFLDATEALRSRVALQVILATLGSAVAACVLFTALRWSDGSTDTLAWAWAFGFGAVCIVDLLVALWLLQRGRRTTAARLAAVGLHVFVLFAVAWFGGTRTVAAAYLPALIAISGLLLGPRAGMASLALCLGFLAVDHTFGPLRAEALAAPQGERLVDWGLGVGMTGAFILLAMHHYERFLRSVVEHEVREQEAHVARDRADRFRAEILARSPAPVLLVGADGALREVNEAALALIGELGARPLHDVLVWPGGTSEALLHPAEGEPIPVRVQAAQVTDPDGAPCAILALHDLRPQRLAADQQRQALLHAEASSRTKTMFLAGVSHELRTPLNAILGYGEMLGEDLEDPDQQEDVGRILAAGRHLLALIDDVLDISQVESGRLDIVEEPVDLAAVFEELEAACRPALRRSGHRLAVDLPAGLPSARADRNRVRQVLANLVGNAIKYTPAGAIDLAVRCDGTWLRVEVVDDGPGLDEELLPTLFEPFRRGRHDVQGTGLGLALSRTLAEGMGGTLTAANHARRGARFTLELRAGRRPSRLGPAASGPPDAVHGARKPFHTQFTAAPSAPHTGR